MKFDQRLLNRVTTAIAVVILIAAVPEATRELMESGRIYMFSADFIRDLPERLTGPGKMRFIIQPGIAIILGVRDGLHDFRAGHNPYLHGLIFGTGRRRELVRQGLAAVRSLVAMGIVADAIAQWLIYGIVHPGAALLIGPILIGVPYVLARAGAWRVCDLTRRV